MNCPFCKRNSSETTIRYIKDDTSRCMTCGWKWLTPPKPRIVKRKYGWIAIPAPHQWHKEVQLNNYKAKLYVEKLNEN